jgi:DNA-binding PadR family transcriptional regulator
MRYRSSEKTIINLLTAIAENREFAQYDMKKAIGKNYRTVLRYLPKLESCNLIQLSRTESSRKKGKDRKIYNITLLGIIELLKTRVRQTKDFVELTDKMAALHPEVLPLVFGKWQLFDENQKILISLRLEDFVRQAPSHLNTLTTNTKALYDEVKEKNMANAQNLEQKSSAKENPLPGTFSEETAQGYKTVATGEAALQAFFKMTCGSHDLKAVEEKVTKSVLSDWTIHIEINPQGNLAIDKLTEDYFRILTKDNELRSYMDQELSYTEETIKIKLHIAQKFNQWWRNLSSDQT